MFSLTLAEAFASVTPEACQSLIAAGVTFTVAVENQRGEWFLLHADGDAHAGRLARNWVDTMGARGASCWKLTAGGRARKPSLTVYEDLEWEDAA
jgi:hypothetical protein